MPFTSTTAAQALAKRLKARKLPAIDGATLSPADLARAIAAIKEHIRMYEGDSGNPKERFVTVAELEATGLVTADVKNNFAFVSKVYGEDVSQPAGTTDATKQAAKRVIAKKTKAAIASSSEEGGGATGAAKVNDLVDFDDRTRAIDTFARFDGTVWKPFALFNQPNIWRRPQEFQKPFQLQELEAGPKATDGLGYIWVKDDAPSTLWFTDDTGVEYQLGTSGVPTIITVANEVTDTTCFPLFVITATGDLAPKTNAGLTFNAATANLNSTLIAGIANANLVDKAATEDISGEWTHSGRLITDDSTTSRAGFNIPTGVRPTSPVQGDIWVTATDILARIDGHDRSLIDDYAGLGGRRTCVNGILRNNGADTALSVNAACYHGVLDYILIAADNDTIMTLDVVGDKPQQIATLPTAATSPARGIQRSWFDGGVNYIDGAGAQFRSTTAMSSWTAMAVPTGTRGPYFTIDGDPLIYAYDGSTGERSLSTSDDNGATWVVGDIDLISVLGSTSSLNGYVGVTRDGTAVLMAGDGSIVAYSLTPDDNSSYEVFTMVGSGGNIGAGDISTDKARFVVGSTQGTIMICEGGIAEGNETTLDLAQNLFRQTASNGITPSHIVYSDKLEGFFVFGSGQPWFGFIPDEAMTTMIYGVIVGGGTLYTFSSTTSNTGGGYGYDRNGDFIIPGLNNSTVYNLSR